MLMLVLVTPGSLPPGDNYHSAAHTEVQHSLTVAGWSTQPGSEKCIPQPQLETHPSGHFQRTCSVSFFSQDANELFSF
jgi:hypothetical protein